MLPEVPKSEGKRAVALGSWKARIQDGMYPLHEGSSCAVGNRHCGYICWRTSQKSQMTRLISQQSNSWDVERVMGRREDATAASLAACESAASPGCAECWVKLIYKSLKHKFC
eukprot:scaffold63766_cov21-Tisochrysis_lutea.AAC.3